MHLLRPVLRTYSGCVSDSRQVVEMILHLLIVLKILRTICKMRVGLVALNVAVPAGMCAVRRLKIAERLGAGGLVVVLARGSLSAPAEKPAVVRTAVHVAKQKRSIAWRNAGSAVAMHESVGVTPGEVSGVAVGLVGETEPAQSRKGFVTPSA